jgi:hypothetical protein
MKYAVEMGSCGMIYIPSFIKIGSGIQKIHRDTDCMEIAKPALGNKVKKKERKC